MRILITGVCGFAGSTIARGLPGCIDNLHIVGLDNLSRKGSETNIEPLRTSGIDVLIGDVRNPEEIARVGTVDWVIDCAANPSVLAGVNGAMEPRELLDHNLIGTINLLEFCRERGSGFILLSTSRVYSIPPLANLPVKKENKMFVPDEECAPLGLTRRGVSESFSTEPPLSLYGNSKRCSELLALEYGEAFEFPVRINRCGVLASAGQFGKADQGIFSFWIHSWRAGRPLNYIGFGGEGCQVRDCLHPKDLVPALAAQMKHPVKEVPRILNFSGGERNAMSLANLSEWCAKRFGHRDVGIDPRPRPFDIPWLVLDPSAAQDAWDWTPSTSLYNILEEIARHADENPGWLEMVGA